MLTLHQKRWLTKFFSYLYLVAILIFTFLPILWMISSAFKPIEDLFIIPPQWIPKNPTLSTMNSVIFGDYGRGSLFPVYFKNSLIVTIGTTMLCLVVATLAAYAFSRYPFRGSNGTMIGILSTQMFPQGMLLISLYLTFMRLKMLNHYEALILANTTFAIPFAIWISEGLLRYHPERDRRGSADRRLQPHGRPDACSSAHDRPGSDCRRRIYLPHRLGRIPVRCHADGQTGDAYPAARHPAVLRRAVLPQLA